MVVIETRRYLLLVVCCVCHVLAQDAETSLNDVTAATERVKVTPATTTDKVTVRSTDKVKVTSTETATLRHFISEDQITGEGVGSWKPVSLTGNYLDSSRQGRSYSQKSVSVAVSSSSSWLLPMAVYLLLLTLGGLR